MTVHVSEKKQHYPNINEHLHRFTPLLNYPAATHVDFSHLSMYRIFGYDVSKGGPVAMKVASDKAQEEAQLLMRLSQAWMMCSGEIAVIIDHGFLGPVRVGKIHELFSIHLYEGNPIV